jgi:hypothetical protein
MTNEIHEHHENLTNHIKVFASDHDILTQDQISRRQYLHLSLPRHTCTSPSLARESTSGRPLHEPRRTVAVNDLLRPAREIRGRRLHDGRVRSLPETARRIMTRGPSRRNCAIRTTCTKPLEA